MIGVVYAVPSAKIATRVVACTTFVRSPHSNPLLHASFRYRRCRLLPVAGRMRYEMECNMNCRAIKLDKSKLALLSCAGEAVSDRDLLRPCLNADRRVILRDLLPQLERSYPGSDRWLPRRLDDILAGSARAFLARDLHGLRAIAIETPKGAGRLKLSTVWVAERARHNGLGSRLIAESQRRWLEAGLQEVWVTVSPRSYQSMSKLLVANGFLFAGVDPDRYGEARPEAIFSWRPEQIAATIRPRISIVGSAAALALAA